MASIWKTLLVGSIIAIMSGVIDLYVVSLADRWVVQKVGGIGHLSGVLLLFLPKLVFGLLVGVGIEFAAARMGHRQALRTTVLLGLLVYFVWKFKVIEVWIAPELFAYVLALGPYIAFFLSCVAMMFFMGRQQGAMD